MSFLEDYEPVEERLAKFWADHPGGRIITEMLPAPEGQWIVKASVFREYLVPPEPPKGFTWADGADATGHAHEHVTAKGVNSTSALENCETSAIGRALANLGYAAKGKRPSREEMQKAKRTEEPTRPDYAVWLAEAVEIFKAWNEDERKLAYSAAMKRIGLESMTTIEDAQRVFAEMEMIYKERPMLEDE